MKVYVIFFVLLMELSVTDAQYYGIVKNKDTKRKSFNEYPNTALTSLPQIREESTTDYQECIRICEYEEVTCESLNVITAGKETFKCVFFAIADGIFEERNDTLFISKKEPICSGYCDELSYMDLCGNCKCRDKCNSLYSHYCDCTEVLRERKNCKTIRGAGFLLPAVYNIKINSEKGFKGFCENQNDGTAWLTMMRRMVIDDKFSKSWRTMADYIKGFGEPHDPIYWLGLNKIVAFTQSSNTILRVVLWDSSGIEWFGEYEGFKVDGQYNYDYTSYHTDCCQIDNGFAEVNNKPFSNCQWNENFWFDNCQGVPGYLTEKTTIRWGRTPKTFERVSLLLRHGSLQKEKVVKYNGYGQWTSWSCSVTCGTGTQTRRRPCHRAPAGHEKGGVYCDRDNGLAHVKESKSCNNNPCPISGGYSGWSQKTKCPVTCGGGTKLVHRKCNNPPPQYGGMNCKSLGPAVKTTACNTNTCPELIKWFDGGRKWSANGYNYIAGYVAIYNKLTGEYGTICDDDFTEQSADVLCRMAGYPNAEWNENAYAINDGSIFGWHRTDIKIMLDDLVCPTGLESDVDDCSHKGWGAAGGCFHHEDVGIKCWK